MRREPVALVADAAALPEVPSADPLAALVAAARTGDLRAQEELLRALRPGLLRYALARLSSRERAEDVAQETCLAVLAALPRYEERGVPFAALAFRIAAHKVADAHRAHGRRRLELVADLPETADTTPGPAEQVERAEQLQLASRLLAQLPEKHREILLLRVAGGLSAIEVAEVVGSTPGAVRVTQHRALQRLRELAAGQS